MEAGQVLEVLKTIRGAYNRFEINEEMPRVWHETLKDEPYDLVIKRLKRHIRESKYEPTMSDLLPNKEEREKLYQDHIINLSKGRD